MNHFRRRLMMSKSRNPFWKMTKRNQIILASVLGSVLFLPTLTPVFGQQRANFQLVEATIEDIHNAIKTDQITWQELVQLYINRAKAYNGVCTLLITEDGILHRHSQKLDPGRTLHQFSCP